MRFKGWKHIFSFNYFQYIKTKAFIISTIVISLIFSLIIAGINIIPSLAAEGSFDGIFGDDDSDRELTLDKLYIFNDTFVPIEDLHVFDHPKAEINGFNLENFNAKCEEIAKGDKAEAALFITEIWNEDKETVGFTLKLFRPENEDILSEEQAEIITAMCSNAFKDSLLLDLGVKEEDLQDAKLEIDAQTAVYGAEQDSFIRDIAAMLVPMIISLIMFSFIVSYAQIIAQSIAQEKTSRVIELLITSVRPLAIIVGKVLAMLLVALTQVAVIVTVCGLTMAVTLPFSVFSGDGGIIISDTLSAAGETVSEAAESVATGEAADIISELQSALPGLFNIGSIAAIIITLLLGFIFYALLAGLVGAGVSRSEDLAAAIQPLAMIAMLGFFLSYMSAAFNEGGDGNIIMTISRYLPISSPFALPSAILMGDMTVVQTVISIVILALLTVLTALLVSKVYETIILYSGNPLKLGQIIKMARKKEQ